MRGLVTLKIGSVMCSVVLGLDVRALEAVEEEFFLGIVLKTIKK